MMMHVLGSPLIVPLTDMVPFRFHLLTVVANAAGALIMLVGGFGTGHGICSALRANKCAALRAVDYAWSVQEPSFMLLQQAMWQSQPDASLRRGCVVVLWSVHLVASVLMTCVLYYTELRSRLQWLVMVSHNDPRMQSAALALLHSGMALMWTWSTATGLVAAGLTGVSIMQLFPYCI